MLYTLKDFRAINELLENAADTVEIVVPKDLFSLYGMLVVDIFIKKLLKRHPKKISKIILDVGDDHATLFTAIRLGYKNIIYNGMSNEAKNLLKD